MSVITYRQSYGCFDDTTADKARLVWLDVGSHNGGTRDRYFHHCGCQVEQKFMIGRMRIAKIIKFKFIIASTISFDPSQKSLLILITTLILPLSPKMQRYWSILCSLLFCYTHPLPRLGPSPQCWIQEDYLF